MGFFRRVVVPSALAAMTVALAGAAILLDRDGQTATADVGPQATTTPLLSPRRLPEFVTTPGADLSLRLQLIELVKMAPPDSCLVVEAGGREVLAHEPDRALVPASNEKTALAAAIIEVLGPDHRLSTEVRGAAADGTGLVRGDIWLVGGGDPQLSTDDYAGTLEREAVARTSLEALADAVAAAGITRVTGRLLADESRYDRARSVASWRPDDSITSSGPLSALSLNDGFASFPTATDPTAPRQPSPDPPRTAAAALAFLLAARGVTVDGGVDVSAAPEDATVLAQVDSAPLGELVAEMLAYSDNQTAELLAKELGVQVSDTGTTAAGASAIAQVLDEAGLEVAEATFVDGSGLSDTNRLTCELLAGALADVGVESPVGEGLAVAGESGTLAGSFEGTPAQGRLRAKTGSLNDVRSLAGFVTTEDADDIVFALVFNRPPFIQPEDAELRDQIGLALAEYPQRPPLDEIEPLPTAE